LHRRGNGVLAAPNSAQHDFRLEVRGTNADGASAGNFIEWGDEGARRVSTGSDAGRIGVWPERHLIGTQLGPNRNRRKW
jgi:3',5'-cyclic-AMP phosphodiesterase